MSRLKEQGAKITKKKKKVIPQVFVDIPSSPEPINLDGPGTLASAHV